ncbi:hypothetical protein OH76DRAFT_916430 [Lentinus brumalis]|uniref:Uncharacterized protein n=1 Tax=Lentinus brumalis TaxID=2498619 RepID=A0A371D079_9APHY|nr:hypothetical protein OH76DRAFT_916430 [Polyporus brumalis]
MSRTVPVPPVLCTGFDITEALWRYLEVGHDIPLVVADPPADEEDRIDEVIAALDRETILMMSFRQHFGLIRRTAPAEDRKLLEIPYVFQKQLRYPEDSKWYTRLFIPTGAYSGECYTSGALATPPQHDLRIIRSWIECANRLLPDDEARERAGFKLEDLQFTVRSVRGVTRPPYYHKSEREELLPPRHLQKILKVADLPAALA